MSNSTWLSYLAELLLERIPYRNGTVRLTYKVPDRSHEKANIAPERRNREASDNMSGTSSNIFKLSSNKTWHNKIYFSVLFCSALAAGDITQIYKNLDIRWGQNSTAIDKISTIKQNIREPTGKWITWIKQLCRNSPVHFLATVQLYLNHLSPIQLFIRAI